MRLSDKKVQAVQNSTVPSVSEVPSFLVLVQYCAQFIPDLTTIAEPIQSLTQKNTPFNWGKGQQCAFTKLKDCLTYADMLAHVDPSCKTRVVADVQPYGLGAVLMQPHGLE